MGGSFQTSPGQARADLQPLRVPMRAPEIFAEAKDMVADLARWRVVSVDEQARVLVCERDAGLLGGRARITIRVEGPDGLPSATVHVRSESRGGLLSRDRAHVLEFLRPFQRRVC